MAYIGVFVWVTNNILFQGNDGHPNDMFVNPAQCVVPHYLCKPVAVLLHGKERKRMVQYCRVSMG